MPSRGKGNGGKRNNAQRDNDYKDEARLYLQGNTQQQVREYINSTRPYKLSLMQICYDIKVIRQRWVESQMIDFNEAKSKELSKIDHLEITYWEAWMRSLQPQTTEYMEKVDDQSSSQARKNVPTYSRKKQKRETKTTTGDVKFLDGVQWCINKRCQILGFNAPEKFQIDWRKEAVKEGVNASDVFEKMVQEFVGSADENRTDGQTGLDGEGAG